MPGIDFNKWRYRPSHKVNRPVGTPEVPQPDNLATWPSSATFTTEPLPATESADPYFIVFEVTKKLAAGAINDTYGLRFTGPSGAHLAHLRTAANRIFVGGTFTPGAGIPIIVYWGKTGVQQPGNGFPAPTTMMAPFLEFTIFENGAAIDYAANPAPFTVVGAPTFIAGVNGQAMQCGPGNYIQTMAAKLRGNARNERHVMALIRTSTTDAQARTICWANWTNDQRGFQLWGAESYVELYIDDNGLSPYEKWVNRSEFTSGVTFIGCSWTANSMTAIVQRDQEALLVGKEYPDTAAPGPIFNSNSPYIIGGTPVAGSYHADSVETVLELFAATTVDQHKAFALAWRTNEQFLGIDRTPNAFTAAPLVSQELNVEVAFAKIQITGISAGTPISISGGIAPTFAISSSLTGGDDVRTKSAAATTIANGQYVKVWDYTSTLNSATVQTNLTVGTLTVPFTSTTKPKAGTVIGGTGIPSGAATYTVSSLAAGQALINSGLDSGEILEFTPGDYKGQGTLTISGKDWSAGAKAVIRAGTHGYRGPHPSQGGLFVSGEGAWQSGSGGAEFSAINVLNSKNFVLEGIRLWVGQGYESNWNQFIAYAQNAVFKNCRFAGHKASGYPGGWLLNSGAYTWGTERVPQGFAIKEASGCLFENCLFQYVKRGVWIIGGNSTYDGCVWTDTAGDHVYMSHPNSGQKFIRCVFFRMFPGSSSFHCDALQCTSKDANASSNQVYELCVMGPGNSNYPHIQGPFLEQDNSAFLGPEGVIIKTTLIENRTSNACYMRPAKNCQAQSVSMVQNQFGGIDTNNRDTLLHTPQINFNASGTSRGGNLINKTVYISAGIGGGDSITNSYQLAVGNQPTMLFNYPAYSPGLWQPCMFLNGNCAVDATELKRMAPKTNAPFHPNQADIGAHALFTHYGALP